MALSGRKAMGIKFRRSGTDELRSRHRSCSKNVLLAGMSGLVILASGCSTMVGPDFVRPDAQVTDEWPEMENPGLTRGDADYHTWWKAFNDPVLDRIIEKTYQQNLTLQAAGLRILQARARLGIATGNLYPQQQLGFGEYATNRLSENPGSPWIDNQYQSLDIGFDAAWELDIWGKFRRSVESGVADLKATVAGYDDILVSITAESARSYIQIRTLEKRLAITRENVSIQKRSLELAQARFEGGEVSRLDVTQARSLLRNTQAQIPSLESSLRQTKNALAILLGILPGELDIIITESRGIPAVSKAIVVEVPAELLRRRPDIRLAEQRIAAQSPQIGIAKADLYPHFVLFGTIGWQATNASAPGEDHSLGDIFSSKNLFWKAGPSFSWDIFNYGRIRNRVRAEDALLQQTIVQYRDTVLKAQKEVEDAIVAFLRSREEEKFLADSVNSSRESVDLSLLQYEEGLIDFQRVLDTQRVLSAQANRFSETNGKVGTNLVALYKALGGGWQVRVGREIINADTVDEMSRRTDWGGLLKRSEIELPGPNEKAGARGKWRRPDW